VKGVQYTVKRCTIYSI